jgi:YidC/Oxa1 family membrane protein insertase
VDTRRLLIAALLSLAVMIAWGYFFPAPEPPRPVPAPDRSEAPVPEPVLEAAVATAEAVEKPPPAIPQPAGDTDLEPVVAASEQRTVVEGQEFRAEFTNRGAQLVSFQLLHHQSADGGPVDLVRSRESGPYLFGLVGEGGGSSPLNDQLFELGQESGGRGGETLNFRYRGPAGDASKRFTFRPDGMLELEIRVASGQRWAAIVGPGIRNPTTEEITSRFARRSAIYRVADGSESVDPNRVKTAQAVAAVGLRWIGLQDTYFLTAIVPTEGLGQVVIQPAIVLPGVDGAGDRFSIFQNLEELADELRDLERELYLVFEPEGEQLKAVTYLGAKEYDRLAELPYGLEETVQLGWFKFLSLPLLWGLRWIHDNLLPNYGWAIILMTILIRLLLFPLTHKSTVSMQKMQEINPKVQAIRQKYRAKLKDKQGRPNPEMQRKMNEETMALYKAEGVNPAGGCLPMLLQIPVLFAFYNILSAAIEIRHAPWIFWIQDLSAKDPLYVLPIVMGGTQFLQQRMTPQAGDPMQRRMFALMPIFFTVLFLGFPSGLVLYWLTNNVLGIGQQLIYKRLRESKGSGEKKD